MHRDPEPRNWSAGLQPGAINLSLVRRAETGWDVEDENDDEDETSVQGKRQTIQAAARDASQPSMACLRASPQR